MHTQQKKRNYFSLFLCDFNNNSIPSSSSFFSESLLSSSRESVIWLILHPSTAVTLLLLLLLFKRHFYSFIRYLQHFSFYPNIFFFQIQWILLKNESRKYKKWWKWLSIYATAAALEINKYFLKLILIFLFKKLFYYYLCMVWYVAGSLVSNKLLFMASYKFNSLKEEKKKDPCGYGMQSEMKGNIL